MNIAVISTGTELLRGGTVNTNLAVLGTELTRGGAAPVLELAVGDREGDLWAALGMALRHAELIVITGGLGPTTDDITLETVARFFGAPLRRDPELVRKVEEFWARRHPGGHCPKQQYKQAMVPEGATVIPNPDGSASGIEITCDYDRATRHVFLAPGPPSEFVPMARHYLAPRLLELAGRRETVMGFLVAGTGEAATSAAVRRVLPETDLDVAYTAKPEGTCLYLAGTDRNALADALRRVAAEVAPAALPEGEFHLAPWLIAEFRRRGLTLSTAESCTGGLAGAEFTAVPGASDVYMGGAVTYSNRLKHQLLGVPEELLAARGAVSAEVAAAMAEGAAKNFGTDAAIAITGIAGPGGGTPEKPVGLVYVGAALRGKVATREWRLRGERDAVRTNATAKALLLLRELLLAEGNTKC